MENEIEKKEIITKGIKTTMEIRDQFERLAKTANKKDGEFLELVLNQYEQRSLAASAPGREIELTNVEMLLSKLRAAFAGSVALCNDAEARVRNELKNEINAMQEAVAGQKEKVSKLVAENETYKASAESAEKKYNEQCSLVSELQNDLAAAEQKINNEKTTIETLQGAISTITNENAKLNDEIKQIPELEKSITDMMNKNHCLEQELEDTKKENSALTSENQKLNSETEKIPGLQKAIADATAKIAALEQQIENMKKQNQIDVAAARLEEREKAQKQVAQVQAEREKAMLEFVKEIKNSQVELVEAKSKKITKNN